MDKQLFKIRSEYITGKKVYLIDIDPSEPYLADHDVGVPLFGTVLSLEAMSEAIYQDTGMKPDMIRDLVSGADCLVKEKNHLFCEINKDETDSQIRYVRLLDADSLVFQCCMHLIPERHIFHPTQNSLPVFHSQQSDPDSKDSDKLIQCSEEIYRILFHGPAFQVLRKVYTEGEDLIGEYENNIKPLLKDGTSPVILPMRMIEFCLQTSGMRDLMFSKAMRVPLGIGSIRILDLEYSESVPALARASGKTGSYDICAFSPQGKALLKIEKYQTKEMPYH